MEEEFDSEQENASNVLDQEYTELLHILNNQPSAVIKKLCAMVPNDYAGQMCMFDPTSSSSTIKALLGYYRQADSSFCRDFLQYICFLCENIPMWLESRLMSVSGNPASVCDISRRKEESSEKQIIKRPRIDYWEQYITSAKDLLMMRWGTTRKHLVMDVELDNVWVNVKRASKTRERPEQTLGSGSRTTDLKAGHGLKDPKVTLDIFLQGCTGKVTVLYGPPGSGKTILMSRLGELWASNLGPIPSSHFFVLLEFRHLNLLSEPISLHELLFKHYLLPEGTEDKQAILDYLVSNPEQSCWVLDGYDEFYCNLNERGLNNAQLDPRIPRPVAELISGLLNRHILPGCTVIVTCRDAADLEGQEDKVAQLQHWNHHEIKKYVEKYFELKGNLVVGEHATKLLLSNQQLVAMSALPALCNISCICVEYLLQKVQENGKGKEDIKQHKKDVLSVPQMPSTLSQVYLMSIGAFLSRCSDQENLSAAVDLSQSVICHLAHLVSHYKSELTDLCKLAWNGLETRKIVFLEKEIPCSIIDFSVNTGFFSKTELRQRGSLVNVYYFIHVTVQEFLSALKIMTSMDDKELKNRLSLKTRWPSKSSQRTPFTNSLHLFLSGLASPCCSAILSLLTKADHNFIKKRQETVKQLIQNMCQPNMTGPKVLELCHCVQEFQDKNISKQLMRAKRKLELHNMTLLPKDLDALAFVLNSSEEKNAGLDLRGCSITPESLELLSHCSTLNDLSFHSRKYGDSFAEKLTTVLPKLASLEKLSFCNASLTARGAAHLASALLECPCIAQINLSGNNLKDEGVKHITDIVSKLPWLSSLNLGHNNTTLKAAVCLIKEISSLNIQRIYIDGGVEELIATFDPNCDKNSSPIVESQVEVSLLRQKWIRSEMHKLAQSLAQYPPISVLDLSGGHWKVETLKELVNFLPKFNVTERIILNGSCSSIEAVIVLTALMSESTTVREIHIRRKSPSKVIIVCAGSVSKSLSLSSCFLQPSDLDKVLKSLGQSSHLTSLDLSSNTLGDEGIKILLSGLSFLRRICEINASNNGITMEGVKMLAGALCCHNHLTQIHTSHNGSQTILLKFCSDQGTRELRIFRANNSSITSEKVTSLCTKLSHCQLLLHLDLSYSPLSDDTIKSMTEVLPKMTSLQTLNLTACSISTPGALMLVRGVICCQRVKSVQLSSQKESVVLFDKRKSDQFSCRLSHFNLDRQSFGNLLETLQSGPQLSELDLSSNSLDENNVKHFVETLPRLKVKHFINLSNNGIKQQGVLDVATTLATCDNVSAIEVCLVQDPKCIVWLKQGKVKHLRLTGATLTRSHQDQLIKIISRRRCPIIVELKNCFPESIEEFVEKFSNQCGGSTLNIEESWIRSEEAVRLLCHCLELNRNIGSISIQQTTLQLSLEKFNDTTHITNCGDTEQQASTVTKKIGLVDCDINGSHLAPMEDALLRCPSLTELDLSHNCLGEIGAGFLSSVIPSLPKLTSLRVDKDVSRCTDFAEILCKSLLQCKNLEYLSLSGCVLSEIAAQTVASVLPCLKLLNLSFCSWSNSGGLQLTKQLTQCEHLEELCLECVHLNQESTLCLVQSLTNAKALRVLKLSNMSPSSNVWDVLITLKGLIHLEDLEMDSWKMNDKEVEQLVRLLPLWTHLQKLCLSQTLYDDQSGAKLLEALKNCTHLKELHISQNNLGDLTATKMALVFPSLTHLCVIDISENNIGPQGSVDLAKAISFLKNLTKMNLTAVGTSELCAVVASLANCLQLQDLRLGWNNCGDDLALEFVRVLPLCLSLDKIDLECNHVSLVGAEALLRALQSCPALKIIRLWKNKVPPAEAEMLSLKDRRLSFSST